MKIPIVHFILLTLILFISSSLLLIYIKEVFVILQTKTNFSKFSKTYEQLSQRLLKLDLYIVILMFLEFLTLYLFAKYILLFLKVGVF